MFTELIDKSGKRIAIELDQVVVVGEGYYGNDKFSPRECVFVTLYSGNYYYIAETYDRILELVREVKDRGNR